MNTSFSRLELKEIARYHKLLLWSILVAIIANLLQIFLNNQSIILIVYFGAAIFQIFVLNKLGRALKLSTILMVLFVIGLFIPLLGLLNLLIMHEETMKAMKAAGIKVGFMGVNPNSI